MNAQLYSSWQLLDEPDLTKDQVWLAWGDFEGGRPPLRMGMVIANSKEEALAAIERYGWKPKDAFSETWFDEQAAKGLGFRFWMWLSGLLKARQKLAQCRADRGNGAKVDGRQFEDRAARQQQIEDEHLGQDAFWQAHPEYIPERAVEPAPEWVAEVRTLGRNAREAKEQETRAWLGELRLRRIANATAKTAVPAPQLQEPEPEIQLAQVVDIATVKSDLARSKP